MEYLTPLSRRRLGMAKLETNEGLVDKHTNFDLALADQEDDRTLSVNRFWHHVMVVKVDRRLALDSLLR